MNYFIAPRSGEKSYRNFQSTIRHGVPFENIQQYLDDDAKRLVLEQGIIFAWGNREGTKAQWDKMAPGDKVIFYASGELVSVGEVYLKQHNPGLALAMWPPDENGKPWQYTYFLKNIEPIKLPMKAFNAVAGYSPKFIIQGFIRISEKYMNNIEQHYGTMEKLLSAFLTEHSPEALKPTEKLFINIDRSAPISFVEDVQLVPKRVSEPAERTGNYVPKKTDYVIKSQTNAIVGSKGEQIVVIEEIERLISKGRGDLAEKVKRVSVDDDSLGYDVLSYDEDGTERYIEVKTSNAKSDDVRIFMSANEMNKSKTLPNYYIYFVDGIKTGDYRVRPIRYPFSDQFLVTTDTYLLQAEEFYT
jgi:hypothetical protein